MTLLSLAAQPSQLVLSYMKRLRAFRCHPLSARFYYAQNKLDQAYVTQLEARDSPGLGWNRADEARLETYFQARELDRRLPLEDESGGD